MALAVAFPCQHDFQPTNCRWRKGRLVQSLHGVATGEDNPDAPVFKDWIPEDKWTGGMRALATFAQQVAEKVLSRRIVVKFCASFLLARRGELI